MNTTYDYDIFGSPITGNYTTGADYGYLGKPYDSITGLYNYGYRDYSPQTVRFTTVDPIRDGANWFAYVNNDPVNYIDLWGLAPKQHTDKTGVSRVIAELKDCVGYSIEVGTGLEVSVSLGTVLNGSLSLDAGTLETVVDKNGQNSYDTVGASLTVSLLDFGEIGVGVEKKAIASDSDKYFDHVKNAWDAETEIVPVAKINVKGNSISGHEQDFVIGIGGQIGIGVSVWGNITEAYDAIKQTGSYIKRKIERVIKSW